jgi:hypothetical protein
MIMKTFNKGFGVLAFVAALAWGHLAHATCLTDAVDNLNVGTNHYATPFNLTIVKGGGSYTSFASNSFSFSTATKGTTTSNTSQLFSDRKSGNQPFYVGSPDTLSVITLTDTGAFHFHNSTWNFDYDTTVTCVAGLTAVAAATDSTNNIQVILTFGARQLIVP